MVFLKLMHFLFSYISLLQSFFFFFLTHLPSPIQALDFHLSLYFCLCGLSPCTADLDDRTTLHFWVPTHRCRHRPSLVMVHGYGGNPLWQFIYQVGPLSRRFNLYVPDLVFFGKSLSARSERSDRFQAESVVEGLNILGVGGYTVYGISYGGFVAYRMAEICPDGVERVMIVSSGIKWPDQEKEDHLIKIGRNPEDILVPKHPEDLRLLVDMSMCNQISLRWALDFLLRDFIDVSSLSFYLPPVNYKYIS